MINQLKRIARGGRRFRAAGWMPAIAGFAGVLALAQPAAADWHDGHDWHGGAHGGWHGRDFARWHRGYWRHGWHGGRFGWWWIAPGIGWTFYEAPVYPYPEPPPLPVAAPGPPPPPAAPATWYYCTDPAGYYPYVERCMAPWQPVPAH
jgi:hypothetical protein